MNEYMTKEMDVLLREGETPESLVKDLNKRFAARVEISPEQYNSALTLLITGTRYQLAGAFAWLATEGKPRFDLRGKPPVGKGEKRTSPVVCRCGYEASNAHDLDEHVVSVPSDDPDDHGETR